MADTKSTTTRPPFPEIGSTVSSRYFCLGRLGKGTFCSIHKCIDLSHAHNNNRTPTIDNNDETTLCIADDETRERIVAAKAELATFLDSGVIDGEASVLKFLHVALSPGSVPTFVDYVRPPPSSVPVVNTTGNGVDGAAAVGVSAIIMEYLPGEDMHLLRDRHCMSLENEKSANARGASGGGTPRRVSVEDAVYLVADVMLPLLKGMHGVGIVHRSVVRRRHMRTCI